MPGYTSFSGTVLRLIDEVSTASGSDRVSLRNLDVQKRQTRSLPLAVLTSLPQ